MSARFLAAHFIRNLLMLALLITSSLSQAKEFALPLDNSQPNWSITPGKLCSPEDANFSGYDYPEHIARCKRNLSTADKRKIADAYGGIPQSEWNNYEFDHLIPLCAGGSDDAENIWPQSLSQAREKDKIENEVCTGLRDGRITQAQAMARVRAWFTSRAN